MSESVVLPEPGLSIVDAFRIECRLGRGSTSAVYGATSHTTGQRFALRCWLSRDAEALAQATRRFIGKANAAQLFQHPNIVEVYTVSEVEGTLFAVTEWLDGTTLERYLQRNGTLSLPQTLELLLPCIDVLAAAHEAGIVHGDLRPANIFMCRDASAPQNGPGPHARVLNFELGNCLPETNAAAALKARWQRRDARQYQYLPPELLDNQAHQTLDARSDVYMFGVLLYRSLAGVLPFLSTDVAALEAEILAGSHVPFKERGTHLAPHVLDVIDRAMSTDPRARYANMRELGIALLRAVSRPAPLHFDRPAYEPHEPSLRERLRHESVRLRAAVSVAAAAFLAVAVLALVQLWDVTAPSSEMADVPVTAAAASAQISSLTNVQPAAGLLANTIDVEIALADKPQASDLTQPPQLPDTRAIKPSSRTASARAHAGRKHGHGRNGKANARAAAPAVPAARLPY